MQTFDEMVMEVGSDLGTLAIHNSSLGSSFEGAVGGERL